MHGFSSGSLNVIARDAKVSKGSLFQYFESKADLCAYLSDVISRRVRVSVEERIAQLCWSEDFFGALRGICDFWMAYFASHPAELAFASAVTLEPDAVTGLVAEGGLVADLKGIWRERELGSGVSRWSL